MMATCLLPQEGTSPRDPSFSLRTEKFLPVLCLGPPFRATRDLLGSLPPYSGNAGLAAWPQLPGENTALLEFSEGAQDSMLAAGLRCASVVVAGLESFAAEWAAEELLEQLAAPHVAVQTVVWVASEAARSKADRLLRFEEKGEVLVCQDGDSRETLAARLGAVLASKCHLVTKEDFLQRLKGARQFPAARQPAEDPEELESVFASCSAQASSLESEFASRASPRSAAGRKAAKRLLAACRALDRDCAHLLMLSDSALLARAHEDRLHAVVRRFPHYREKFAPLLSAFNKCKEAANTQQSRAKKLRLALMLSLAALGGAATSLEWRVSLLTAGLGGLLSVAVLRSPSSPDGPFPKVAFDVLTGSETPAFSPAARRLLEELEGPLKVVLLVGVNNPDMATFATAFARNCFPYSLLRDCPLATCSGAKILPFHLQEKGLLIALNFRGRNDSRETTFMLKLAISFFRKSKTVVFYGKDAAGANEIRQCSWLKNVIEMSLMQGEEGEEFLLVTSTEDASWKAVRDSFESWQARTAVVRAENLDRWAQVLAEEVRVLSKVEGRTVSRNFNDAIAGL